MCDERSVQRSNCYGRDSCRLCCCSWGRTRRSHTVGTLFFLLFSVPLPFVSLSFPPASPSPCPCPSCFPRPPNFQLRFPSTPHFFPASPFSLPSHPPVELLNLNSWVSNPHHPTFFSSPILSFHPIWLASLHSLTLPGGNADARVTDILKETIATDKAAAVGARVAVRTWLLSTGYT